MVRCGTARTTSRWPAVMDRGARGLDSFGQELRIRRRRKRKIHRRKAMVFLTFFPPILGADLEGLASASWVNEPRNGGSRCVHHHGRFVPLRRGAGGASARRGRQDRLRLGTTPLVGERRPSQSRYRSIDGRSVQHRVFVRVPCYREDGLLARPRITRQARWRRSRSSYGGRENGASAPTKNGRSTRPSGTCSTTADERAMRPSAVVDCPSAAAPSRRPARHPSRRA